MELLAGILLVATFIGLIVYCVKGGNLLVGFLVTSVLWCIIGLVPINVVVTTVFQTSVETYGKTIAIIVFGAWFGRMIVDTGIAGYIIKKTVELAGDKPLMTAILLSVVCALIFTSAFGVGSVMAIGMIVLPILMSLGIDKKTALGAYLLAVAAGMYLNIAYVNQSLALGRWQYGGGRHWNGKISNFKTYNRILTAAEISQNYNALRGRYGL